MEYSREERELILHCWDNRDGGTHGWIPRGSKWLIIEPFEEEGVDFLIVAITHRVDAHGYPIGTCLSVEYLFEEDIEELREDDKVWQSIG